MSEQLKDHDSNIKATKWDDLSEVGFAGEEQTSPERSLLESETQEKIKNNPGAKKALRRLIIGAVAALTLFTGNTIKNHEVAKEISAENEEKMHMPPIDAEGCIANLDNFFDGDGDEDLVWTQNINMRDGTTFEVTDENVDDINAEWGYDVVDGVNISWQTDRGDVYTVIDEDGDGYWNQAAKFSPETGESQSVDLEHTPIYSRYDEPVVENEDSGDMMAPPSTTKFLTSSSIESFFTK